MSKKVSPERKTLAEANRLRRYRHNSAIGQARMMQVMARVIGGLPTAGADAYQCAGRVEGLARELEKYLRTERIDLTTAEGTQDGKNSGKA